MCELQILFDGNDYPISELEQILSFRFLPRIAFESEEEREKIRQRGLAKSDVNEEDRERGRRFCQEIENSFLPKVSVSTVSKKVGYGLFAEESIRPETYVGEYTGIVRRNDRRYFEPLNHYCYCYPVLDHLGLNYVIDATQGHLTRFINHSKRPNLQPRYAFIDGFYHLIFLSMREIHPGEQLSYDYGNNYWSLRGPPELL